MPSISAMWTVAKNTYDALKDTPHEPAARAYLDATARLVLISATTQQRAVQTG